MGDVFDEGRECEMCCRAMRLMAGSFCSLTWSCSCASSRVGEVGDVGPDRPWSCF